MIPKPSLTFRGVVVVAALTTVAHVSAGLATQQAPNGAPVNFSGTWRLDADASEVASAEGLYGLGGSAPEDLYVTQARNGSLILSSGVNGAQPRNYIIGGENALPAPGGELVRMTVASRWDGATLVNEGTGEHEGAPVVVYEALSLGDGGDTLHIEVTTRVGPTEATNRLVYRRAQR